VGKTRRLRSPIIQNSHNPVWNQRATVYVADEADDITVEIKVCTWAGPHNKRLRGQLLECRAVMQRQLLLPRWLQQVVWPSPTSPRLCFSSMLLWHSRAHRACLVKQIRWLWWLRASLLAVRLVNPACAAGLQDADRVGAEFLGLAKIPVKDFISGAPYDQWLDLVDRAGQPVMYADRVTKGSRQARLHMSITYRPVGVKVSGERT